MFVARSEQKIDASGIRGRRSGRSLHASRRRQRTFDALEGRLMLSAAPEAVVLTPLSAGTQAQVQPEFSWVDEAVTPTAVVREFSGPMFSYTPSPPQRQTAANVSGTFQIALEKGPNLRANPTASAAFDQVAAFFDNAFTTPITVAIDAEFAPLADPHIVAEDYSTGIVLPYDDLYSLMVASATPATSVVNRIPTSQQLGALMPYDPSNPFSLVGAVAQRANLKALGIPDGDLPGNSSMYDPSVKVDMSIIFNSNFSFDYSTSSGVDPDQVSFFSVAVHEIAHGMGFKSAVDNVDQELAYPQLGRQVLIEPLDLFRLQPGAGATDFTHSPRVLYTGGDQVTYDGGTFDPTGIPIAGLTCGDIPMSTGYYTGDGAQASHWKDSNLIGHYIGIMDPTVAPGETEQFTEADRIAFELLGYQVKPAPAVGSIAGQLFNDLNADGVHGASEGGLAGWTVYLDTNGNGNLDPGELSTTTNAYGYYSFASLPPGTYHVHEVVPAGWSETYPGRGTGFGWQVDLHAATNLTNVDFGDTPTLATVTSVRVLLKRSIVNRIILAFGSSLNPSRARATANYRLAAAGRDRRFGTRDDVKVRFRSVVYNAAARTVTLTPAGRLVLNKTFQLRLSAAGLIDVYGRPLDGNGDGFPGGDYVALIKRRSASVASVTN
jgi:hypothetical protein